jgi:hypothetical protein
LLELAQGVCVGEEGLDDTDHPDVIPFS